MYHCNVCFYLVGRERNLIQAVRAMTPSAHFTYKFEEDNSLSEASAHKADVIFVNMNVADPADLNTLLNCKKPDSEVIMLADKNQTVSLLSTPLPDVFDLWTLPLTENEISFRLSRWFKNYKAQKDFWLCQNYLDATINSVPHLIWYKDKDGVHKR